MKAAPEAQRKLLDVHALDTDLARLDRREKGLAQLAQLEEIAASALALRDEFMAAQRTLEDTQLEMSRLESDVALVMERLHKDEAKLDSSTSGKEASALTHELETLKKREKQLEEIQFTVMERLDQEQATFDEVERQLDALNTKRSEVQRELEQERQEILRARQEIEAERKSITAALPSDLVELYEQTRERYGVGAALLRGKISEGSNMALADAELATLRETDPNEIVFCQVSGCILVRTEESAL